MVMLHIVGGDCYQLVTWGQHCGVWPCVLWEANALQNCQCTGVGNFQQLNLQYACSGEGR
jgi:hypothetical protein